MERVNTKKTGAELVGSWTVAIGDQDEASMCNFYTGNFTERVVPSLLPPASEGWGKVLFSVCLSVHTSTGGEGGPRSRFLGGGSQVSDFQGGYPVSDFRGGGGVPGLSKRKNF